ncbi:electron transfer flavoprotein subunit alpha/FixB family protein [soil metagenome]
MNVLVIIDHEGGTVTELGRQALTLARRLAEQLKVAVEGVVIGDGGVTVTLGTAVDSVHSVVHPVLTDYAPAAWGEAICQLMTAETPAAVVASGGDRGNEVLAHVAASTDLPMVANVTEVEGSDGGWRLVRVRWGGSLLEETELSAPVKLLSASAHGFPAANLSGGTSTVTEFLPELDEGHVTTRVAERVTREEGITLTTASVVVSGGRGVGGPGGFEPLEELASLLGGAVGCSRVVTNNGWRPHSDQVGQTGSRVAPDLYIACGISGAIQHWVGMMASKKILAVNTDADAPMVTKADYAVIGDVAEIVPAIVAEIRSRRA